MTVWRTAGAGAGRGAAGGRPGGCALLQLRRKPVGVPIITHTHKGRRRTGGRLAALAAGEARLAANLLAARRRAAAHRTAAARRLGRLGEHERAGVGPGAAARMLCQRFWL